MSWLTKGNYLGLWNPVYFFIFLLLTKVLDIRKCLSTALHPSLMVKLRGPINFLSIILDVTPQTPKTIGLIFCLWLCLSITAKATAPQRCPHLLQNLAIVPTLCALRRQNHNKMQPSFFLKTRPLINFC